MNLAIVGATGAVGQEILAVLERKNLPLQSLRCFASQRSAGKTVEFRGKPIVIEELTEESFKGIDYAIFSAGKKVSFAFAPIAVRQGAIVIDNSSAYRLEPDVPLVIPEINAHALKTHKGIIASPNCSATIMLMALAPLHRHTPIKRIVAATYQAASGGGAQVMEELEAETRARVLGQTYQRKVVPHPYAFNLFTHNSPLLDNGYVEEEMKMLQETQKILESDAIKVSATCVRVPILRAHSEALNVEFTGPMTKETAYALLKKAKGLVILEDRKNNRFPMPLDASGQDDVLCGRIREDLSQPNTLEMWVVGDQLLKGAALNAVQILETLCTHSH